MMPSSGGPLLEALVRKSETLKKVYQAIKLGRLEPKPKPKSKPKIMPNTKPKTKPNTKPMP